MTWLVEDPLPIWLIGAVCFTFALVAYLQLRSAWSLITMAGILLIVLLLTGVEQLLVSPRERIEQTLQGVTAALEANDLDKTLSYLAPTAAEVRADAQTAMPRVDITKANVAGTPQIILEEGRTPSRATARFRFVAQATDRRNGMKGGYYDDMEVEFELVGKRWLIRDYRAAQPLVDRWKRSPPAIPRELP